MENMDMDHSDNSMHRTAKNNNEMGMYKNFFLMLPIMFVAMFFLMYSMVDKVSNIFLNIDNVYMTLLMLAAMALIELFVMKGMYTNKKTNTIIIIVSIFVGLMAWFGIRNNWGIGNKQFIRGMIPHHAAALQMSKDTKLTDPDLIKLQQNILSTQAQEIALMKAKLIELENK